MSAPVLRIKGVEHALETTWVMGVVNASPDSFSDGGRFHDFASRVALAEELITEGADVIDVGGQSATTGEAELDPEDEAERVVPIVEWIRSHHPAVLVSVDTYKPLVARAVLDAGAHIINDVSGLRYPEVAGLCADHGAALVVMHTAAPPRVRRQDPGLFADVAQEVRTFLEEKSAQAVALGIPADAIILDPGPDFAKTPHQTLALLRSLDVIRELGRPLLLALSRKDVLGAITNRTPRARGAATDAAIAFFAASGGQIVRVHDVAAAVDVIATVEALSGKREIPIDYVLPDAIRHERG